MDEVTRAEILLQKDVIARRLIFSVLPASRKSFVMHEKYLELLSKPNYNIFQKQFINKLDSIVSSPQTYEKNVDENFHFFLEEIKEEGEVLFQSRNHLRMIMADLDNKVHGISYNPNSTSALCECNTESDWCNFPTDEGAVCTGDCGEGGGCGTFWVYTCNGRCMVVL